jgi:hypothetical protein
MSTVLATSSLQTRKMGWVEEEVKGAIPDDATFNDVLVQDFEPTPNMQNVEQSALGSPYKHKIVKTGERYRVSVNFIPFDSDILMYAINRTGTKTVDQSLTWGISQMMAPAVGTALVEQYQFAKGATCNSITINGSNESVTCDSEWFCTDVTTPAETSGITGTVTWDPLLLAGWTGLSGGVQPITWGAVAQNVRAYSITFDNAVYEDQFLGDAQVSVTNPTTHTVSGSIDIIWSGTSLWADMKTFTPRVLKIELGPSTFITLTDAVLESGPLPRSATSTETTVVSYSLKAPKGEITTA